MVQTFTAYTTEIDDVRTAVADIQKQLNTGSALGANTIGILMCHYEFVFSGVVEALSDALPFEIVGTITSAQATPHVADSLLLTLMVLTSDDVQFHVGCTDSLIGNPTAAIEDTYHSLALPGAVPALIFAFAAFLPQNSGDEYVATFSRLSGNAPCFGTLAIDDTATFENTFVLHNNMHFRDKMTMVLVYGNIQPQFFIASISKNKILDDAALITKSDRHILKEVNGRPVAEYFEKRGLTKASETSYALSTLPFMLDYKDGTPLVAKVFVTLDGDNHAICGGDMPEGSTLYIGVFDKDDVLLTTRGAVEAALAAKQNASGMLIFSCVSRFMSLGADVHDELSLIKTLAGARLPFMMAYSGGEICPTAVRGTNAVNRFHNDSLIICVF